MPQKYHNNARTNVVNRSQIRNSNQTDAQLSTRYNVSTNTINKWKSRDNLEDKSSRPKTIHYALTQVEKALIINIRSSTWQPIDEIHEILLAVNPSISRSSVYRTMVLEGISTVPVEKQEKAKLFKEYSPGYLHIDVTYLPKFDGQSYYLFVAIDRATRLMYYATYEQKTALNTENFMEQCLAFFPFPITHVLTDNGLEFTNRLLVSKKGESCTKPSKLDEICQENNIDHRLTKPRTPQTNGMVERVNGTIKNSTILEKTYQNKDEMTNDLNKFLVFYILHRRHGSLRKELNVKTPMQAVEKWYELNPKIFKETIENFKIKITNLHNQNQVNSPTTL